MSGPLLEVQNLKTYFDTDEGLVRAVDEVSFTISEGKTLGLVGESGCGKSVTALSIIRLVARPGRIAGGKILFSANGQTKDLLQLSAPEMRRVRGGQIAMIFQEPMTSLNPVFTIGNQILEAIRLHRPQLSTAEARQWAIQMLHQVGIPEPERRLNEYPHQFSGGMRQRAMIAMALSCNPKLLIADEPTTALDVTIQAQILDLLRQLQAQQKLAILLITHDLGIVAEMADEVAVMYASKIVEYGPVAPVFQKPLHPYTYLLFCSRPALGAPKDKPLTTIAGSVPDPKRFPPGCKFHPRCPMRQALCRSEEPPLRQIEPGHWARCHFAGQLEFTPLAAGKTQT